MPEPPRNAFQYAIVRVLPRVERGECLNVGVVLLCRPRRFLGARIALDERRLAAFAPGLDPGDDPAAPRRDRAGGRRATRPPVRSRASVRPSGSTGWSRRRARSSSRRTCIPGCATTPRSSSTTSWRRSSTEGQRRGGEPALGVGQRVLEGPRAAGRGHLDAEGDAVAGRRASDREPVIEPIGQRACRAGLTSPGEAGGSWMRRPGPPGPSRAPRRGSRRPGSARRGRPRSWPRRRAAR